MAKKGSYSTPKLRRTGRKKRFGKRFVSSVPKGERTVIPRTLYPEMPPKFRVSLRTTDSSNHGLAANTVVRQLVNCVDPLHLGVHPSGFRQLHLLYSRSHVDKVSIRYYFQALIPDGGAAMGYPINILGVQVPLVDDAAIPGAENFLRWASHPTAKSATLGRFDSGHDRQYLTFSVESSRDIDDPSSFEYCSVSDNAGNLAPPPQAGHPNTPVIITAQQNFIGGQQQIFVLRREITYYVTFTSRHSADMNNPF